MSQKRRSKTGLIAAVVIAVALVDQAVKQIMLSILTEGEPLPVIGDWFRFTLLLVRARGGLYFGRLFRRVQYCGRGHYLRRGAVHYRHGAGGKEGRA